MTEQEMGGTFVFWQPTDSVGNAKIDNQHKKIFSLINSLYTDVCSGQTRSTIEKTIGELAYYAECHFETEKSYLKDLPDFSAHELQHSEFIHKTLKFAEDYQHQPKENLLYEMISFLSSWLRNHIQGTDRQQFALYRQMQNQSNSSNIIDSVIE